MRTGRDARLGRARRAYRQATWFRVTAAVSSAAVLGTLGFTGTSLAATTSATAAARASVATDSSASCQLGNGVKHVVELTFDNVHYFRDNPNVPSDLELMPNLLNFFENNGTFLSNNHTPLIAHTADDILTTLTGLYGDRQGVGIANDYNSYNTDGPNGSFNTTDPAAAFTYWTGQINDTSSPPSASRDTNPNMVYSPVPPATAHSPVQPNTVTPAPWVPFTRAGCNVGDVSTANVELENVNPDIANTFGANSPEEAQLQVDLQTDFPFADKTAADYVGVAVHCAQNNAFCTTAKADRGLQTTPSATAVPDQLPQEPGGYTGFEALFGHRYVAPQLGAGTPNLSRNGFQITNASGNLVDENGNTMVGPFTGGHPGFPGFSHINASQTLAYLADMLESGVPVVQGYISDIHGNEFIPGLTGSGKPCFHAPSALGSGTACYIAQAQYYNAAFGAFFQRLAADGISAANTLFVVSSDEGDHEAGANVGRAVTPQPPTCDGAKVSGNTVTVDQLCTYPAGTFGELGGNITGLLATQAGDKTPFSLEQDTAPEFYVTGDPGPNNPTVRTLERDVAGLTAFNPYTQTTQPITNFIADPTEEAILHFVDADPARTPTFAMFGKPDYFWQDLGTSCPPPTASCVTQNTSFAYDHGAYAAEINTNYVGFAGPGVANLGLDGQAPNAGPNSAGPNSGQVEVVNSGTTGTWVDETDIRPTLIYLTGLTDDYEHDGRVITEILSHPNSALSGFGVADLGACYKQLNSSVGQFGAFTLQVSTNAVESTSVGDFQFRLDNFELSALERSRDALALKIKQELEDAAFNGTPIFSAPVQTIACQALIRTASALAQHS